MKNHILLLIIFSILFIGCAESIEAEGPDSNKEIKAKLEKILPKSVEVTSIEETELEGYLEVSFNGLETVYISSDGKYIISGDIYELTGEGLINKSESIRTKKRKEIFLGFTKEDLISFAPNNVKHEIYVFTDVDCGYCRKFHSEINGYLDLGIQVNYLAFPRTGLESDSFRKVVSAWCNDDPHLSITELKLGKEIEVNLCSNNPVEKHYNLGQKLGISGTPSILTTDGRMIPGYVSPKNFLNYWTVKYSL
ncbi:MAG: thiol:disulfide interchange protein DsbC [Gammaproteobacteria bacterium]|nr:MAG: thiol:disulfide interchange protein DsbC [Gammaproteobacteria bacterium]